VVPLAVPVAQWWFPFLSGNHHLNPREPQWNHCLWRHYFCGSRHFPSITLTRYADAICSNTAVRSSGIWARQLSPNVEPPFDVLSCNIFNRIAQCICYTKYMKKSAVLILSLCILSSLIVFQNCSDAGGGGGGRNTAAAISTITLTAMATLAVSRPIPPMAHMAT